MLITVFEGIKDHRRKEGQRYQLSFILLFSVLAIVGNSNSYRQIQEYINTNLKTLRKTFGVNWKRSPAYTTIRKTIQQTNKEDLEKAFRKHSAYLSTLENINTNPQIIAMDGKVIRGSFDNFIDQSAIQLFSAFNTNSQIILAHEVITENKTNEIPVAQELIKELGLKNCIFTMDALHCQKKH
jgi:hypothetical protein